MSEYSKTYEIRWSDIDANNHVNYAAYIDAAGDLRYRFFTEHGFPPERSVQLGVGPVYSMKPYFDEALSEPEQEAWRSGNLDATQNATDLRADFTSR